MDFLDGNLPSRTNWYIVLYFCRRKAIVFIFFCERKFTTCLQSFAKLMRWVRLWEDGGVFGVDKFFKDLQETCFLEYRAKFSISWSQKPQFYHGVKKLDNGWSKSIVLENKVVLNIDFRSGADKSSQLDHPLHAKLWPNIFQYISAYFTKSWFPPVSYQLDQKQKYFH